MRALNRHFVAFVCGTEKNAGTLLTGSHAFKRLVLFWNTIDYFVPGSDCVLQKMRLFYGFRFCSVNWIQVLVLTLPYADIQTDFYILSFSLSISHSVLL